VFGFFTDDKGVVDWSALHGRPGPLHIVWIRHAADSPADYPNYRRLNWRPVNRVQCAELNSYGISRLSAMITRPIRHETIRYIFAATGEGRRLLPDYRNTTLSWINYVFIVDDEAVRAWLLSNRVLEDPLDLLIYCHRPNNLSREPTPALRGDNYLVPAAVTNWANEAIARDQLCGGLFDSEARRPEPRANPRPANEASEQQEGDDSHTLLVALSGASWDVSGAGDGHEGSVGMLSSTGGERRESPAKFIPLALKWSCRLNIQHSEEVGQHPAQGDMTRKRRGLFNDENCDERKSKRFPLASMARELLESEELRKRSASFDDEDGHERKPKRYRSSL